MFVLIFFVAASFILFIPELTNKLLKTVVYEKYFYINQSAIKVSIIFSINIIKIKLSNILRKNVFDNGSEESM